MRTKKGVRRKRRTATTEEARRWDEEPSVQVKGDRDPHYRSLCQSQDYRPLNVRQSDGTKEPKLTRLLSLSLTSCVRVCVYVCVCVCVRVCVRVCVCVCVCVFTVTIVNQV